MGPTQGVESFSAAVPPLIRRFSTGNPQRFTQGRTRGFLRKSAYFPPDLHDFSLRFSSMIGLTISSAFSCLIPELLADGAGEKSGERRAEASGLRKTSHSALLDHYR
jgi:hypothetical protein